MIRRTAPAAAAVLALLAGCAGEQPSADPDRIVLTPAEDGEGHTHAPGQGHSAQGPIGDGTTSAAGGYRLTDVRLPAKAAGPGELSFRIIGRDGEPLTSYVEEQTKLLHLYVVRDDLAVFRHLHPVLADDGTWTAQVDVGEPGDYRVLTEFIPEGTERPVALAADVTVPGRWRPEQPPTGADAAVGDDGTVRVAVDGGASVGDDGRMTLTVSSVQGEPLSLGSYLGTFAHLTGFEVDSGRFIHVHPYGEPEQTDDGSRLTFHTQFEEPGDYRMFVQVRIDGFVHQVPVTATVT